MEATAAKLLEAQLEDMWYYGNYHDHHHRWQVDKINPQNKATDSIESEKITNTKYNSFIYDESNDKICRELFKLIDEDGDGRISTEELHCFLCNLGLGVSYASLKSIISCFVNLTSSEQNCLDFAQFKALQASLFCSTEGTFSAGNANHNNNNNNNNNNNSAADADGKSDAPSVNIDGDVKCDGLPDDDDDDGEEQLFREAFRIYDKNSDGFISASELASVLTQLRLLDAANSGTLATCQAYIDRLDLDGDGLINFEEFKRMLTYDSTPVLTLEKEPESASQPTTTTDTLTKFISCRSSQLRENIRKISSKKLLEYTNKVKVNSFSGYFSMVKIYFFKVLPLRLPSVLES